MTDRTRAAGRAASAVLLVAPVFWLAGWAALRLSNLFDIDSGRLVAHAVLSVGYVLFAMSALILYRLAAPGSTRSKIFGWTGVGLAVAGALALLGHDLPRAASPMLFVGLIILVLLAVARRGPGLAASPPLVIVGLVLAAAAHNASGWHRVAEGLGAICVWLGFVPLARAVRLPRPAGGRDRSLVGAGTVDQ